MVSPVLLHKQDRRYPDFYGVTVKYISGRTETFNIASHVLTKETGIFEFWTHEGATVNWVPLASVERIEFDKEFTKILEIKKEHDLKKETT